MLAAHRFSGAETFSDAGAVYAALGAGDRFKNIIYKDTGHVYSAEKRAEVLAWFNRWLKPAPNK